jgi:hypothetical protein
MNPIIDIHNKGYITSSDTVTATRTPDGRMRLQVKAPPPALTPCPNTPFITVVLDGIIVDCGCGASQTGVYLSMNVTDVSINGTFVLPLLSPSDPFYIPDGFPTWSLFPDSSGLVHVDYFLIPNGTCSGTPDLSEDVPTSVFAHCRGDGTWWVHVAMFETQVDYSIFFDNTTFPGGITTNPLVVTNTVSCDLIHGTPYFRGRGGTATISW